LLRISMDAWPRVPTTTERKAANWSVMYWTQCQNPNHYSPFFFLSPEDIPPSRSPHAWPLLGL
jgi:hypothetical protein